MNVGAYLDIFFCWDMEANERCRADKCARFSDDTIVPRGSIQNLRRPVVCMVTESQPGE